MLPPDSERVWAFVREQPALKGFVLFGGSALALRIRHRVSEDLDLRWTERRLPRPKLEALSRAACETGFEFQLREDEVTTAQFAEAGLDLHDFRQDFLVNGKVKISFFSAEPPLARVLQGPAEATVRVATIDELFKTKCLVSARRSKTRDWVDLFLLMKAHGFGLRDYRAAFVEADAASEFDIGLSRLCSGVPQKDDEGYVHLLPNAPSLGEMKAFFIAQRDKLEVELAAEAKKRGIQR